MPRYHMGNPDRRVSDRASWRLFWVRRNVNDSIDSDRQIALFQAYHAAIAAHGKTSPQAIQHRNKIVEFNQRLVHRPAKLMASTTSESLQDFEQVGLIGLIRAIELFDPSRNIRFSSYAMGHIRGEMLHHVRDNAINVNPRVSRTGKDLYYRVTRLHRSALATDPDADIKAIALSIKKDNGDFALTEEAWISLQMAMTAGQAAELNEEIAASPKLETLTPKVLGYLPTNIRSCFVEVVIRQSEELPYADRVAIAAKKLRLSVAEVEQRIKMGLDQIYSLLD